MIEVVVNMSDCVSISYSSINYVIFIVPIREVESGTFHNFGSRFVLFIWYYIIEGGMMIKYELSIVYYNQVESQAAVVKKISLHVWIQGHCMICVSYLAMESA